MKENYDQVVNQHYQILQALYKYYPIGVNRPNEGYPGFKQLEKIISEKFQAACDETLEPWLSMVSEMRKKTKFQLVDNTGNNSPCLHLFFIIEENEYKHLSFNIFISLLGTFYTSYYQHQRRFKKGYDVTHLGYTLFKDNPYLLDKEPKIDVEIESIMQKYYPSYFHIKHDTLINNFPIYHSNPFYVIGTPLTNISTPLYDFFFGMIDLKSSIVLE